ncbi:TRPM8 channel-associated factor 2-like, partial [Bombina bombina]|uniref:TRPM8 channel-associated factor 2-like n=1 Tax=Bombina bombina TaxID=8345 RepID=UPI00235A883B
HSTVITSGLQIQIGCQTDNNLSVKANEYIRAPQVTLSLPITKETIKLFTLWGGLVYIILPKGAKLGQFSVTVHGVQKAPYFQKGKTSLSDWRDTIRHYPAPWAELAADNVILSVPTENILSLDNPEELLQFWDEALAKVAELAAIPGHPHPERIVLDVQIPGGSMHSGYPIVMTHADMNTLLDLKKIKDFGTWGIIHELGHNQQKSGWNWEGTNESSNNLWSVYVHEKVVKVSWETAHRQLNPSRREQRIKDYLKDGANIKEWKLFVALETYLQLQEAFGWKPFIELFGDYQKIKYENTDEYKRNLWVELFSQKVKKNLVPFFKMWGFPITAATSDKLSALPEWKENPMKKYVEK